MAWRGCGVSAAREWPAGWAARLEGKLPRFPRLAGAESRKRKPEARPEPPRFRQLASAESRKRKPAVQAPVDGGLDARAAF